MVRRKLALVVLIVGLSASCTFAAAPDVRADLAREMAAVEGTSWYGVYFLGKQKCGFAKMVNEKSKLGDQQVYTASMTMDLTIKMGAAVQRMSTAEVRHYRLTGELARVESSTASLLGKTDMVGEVKDDKIMLTFKTAGRTSTETLPAPKETLETTVLASRRFIEKGEIGGSIQFEVFETTMQKPIAVTSKLVRFDERLIGGVKTRIAVIESEYRELGMSSTEYVTAGGDLIETVVGGFLTLRKEPEKVAKDVRAAFDAMRASIIAVDKELGDPREVASLKLRLSGIKLKELLIDDDRQSYERSAVEGAAAKHVVTLKWAEAPTERPLLPMKLGADDKEIAKFLEPSALAQSDAPEIVEAAKKIVGRTTDPYDAACKIQSWVYTKVKKKGLAALSNALGVLQKMEGDCSEHSILFVALCRAAGIPARQAVGIGYSHAMKGFGYHAWGEVYVGRWVAMDPTWGEDLADPTHVTFVVGDVESMGPVAGLFGSLKIEVVELKRKGE